MPFYQQIIVALPKYPKEGLVAICRKHAKTIIDNGGLVRGIENHGVRPLSERARRSVRRFFFLEEHIQHLPPLSYPYFCILYLIHFQEVSHNGWISLFLGSTLYYNFF